MTTITKKEIFPRVKNVIIEMLGLEGKDILLGTNLKEELGMESLDSMDLAIRLEREFGLPHKGRDVFEATNELGSTVQTVVDFIETELLNS